MDHEVYIGPDTDIDYISVISELQFQVTQLKFKIEQLNKTVNNRTNIIKMLEYTLNENRNWDSIEPSLNSVDESQNNNSIPNDIKENVITCHNLVNHINTILMKRGLFKNHKLSLKVLKSIQNINII